MSQHVQYVKCHLHCFRQSLSFFFLTNVFIFYRFLTHKIGFEKILNADILSCGKIIVSAIFESFFREACFLSIEVFNTHFVGGDNSVSCGNRTVFAKLFAVFDDSETAAAISFLAVDDAFIGEVVNKVGGVLVKLVKFCVLIIHYCNSFRLLFFAYCVAVFGF